MNEDITPQVAVIGTGYVGLTTGVCLAHLGHQVVCCDIDPAKVEQLQAGVVPIFEAGIDELMAAGMASGRLTFALGADPAVRTADTVFLCVPTPQEEDGSADLSYVTAAATELGPLLRPDAIVVNKSTVPVGSAAIVAEALGRDDVHVASNPEFLREGTAVHDFLHPDRVVIGASTPEVAGRVADLYGGLDTKYILTDTASAEVIKYAANGFLAMKLSFINSVAALCETVGADVLAVADGIGTDERIGPQFLRPGPGWGGSCFPKDSRAVIQIANDHGYDFTLMRYVIQTNEEQFVRMVHKVIRATRRSPEQSLTGVVIAALGLTFKAGTDDLRDSPSLRICDELVRRGAHVQAYDPTTTGELSETQADRLASFDLRHSAASAAKGADVLVVLTDWPEFSSLDLHQIGGVLNGHAVVDCRNLLDPAKVRAAGLTYDGVGRA